MIILLIRMRKYNSHRFQEKTRLVVYRDAEVGPSPEEQLSGRVGGSCFALFGQISAEAEVAGLDIGITTAQQFVQSGLDQQRTRQIFGDVAAATPGIQFSAAAQGVNITDEEIATGLAGLSPEELSVIRGITTRAESESSVATGATQTQTGEVTGLIES